VRQVPELLGVTRPVTRGWMQYTRPMKAALLLALVVLVGCSSPTAPTPPGTVQPPPVVITPPPVVMAPLPPNPLTALLADPRFDRGFYRQFALGGGAQPLRRQEGPPNLYLYTVDDAGTAIDARTLTMTAAALIDVAGSLTGRFGLAGLQTGTGPAPQLPNMITVFWFKETHPALCGEGSLGGRVIRLYPNTPGCRCAGNPASMNMAIVKHELGHTLGYYHTDSPNDLMFGGNTGVCDQNPSEREIFHARVAYSMPLGSLDP
jgi:hypothetical protein